MFTQKLDQILIKHVKAHPILYDSNHEKYMDYDSREVAWHKIGDELKRPAADCKVRWIHIRDVYRRITKKALSNPNKKIRMYKYANELAFLKPVLKDIFADNNSQYDYDNDDGDVDDPPPEINVHKEVDEIDDADEDPEVVYLNAGSDDYEDEPVVTKHRKKSTKRKRKASKEKTFPTCFDTVPPAELDPTEPIDSFLLSIRSIMKTFDPYHQNLARSKIFALVQEHELQQIMQQRRSQPVVFKGSTSIREGTDYE